MRLASRILLPILATLALVGAGALALALDVTDGHAEAQAQGDLARASGALAAGLADEVRLREASAQDLAARAPAPWRSDAAFSAMAARASSAELAVVAVLDAQGREVARFEDGSAASPRADAQVPAWALSGLAADPAHAIALDRPGEVGDALVVLAAVRSPDGTFAGAVEGIAPVPAPASAGLPVGAVVRLEDGAGRPLLAAPAMPADAFVARASAATLRAPDGSPVAWTVRVGLSEAAVTRSQLPLAATLVGAVVAGALAVTLVVVLASRHALAPLRQVVDAVDRIAAGDLQARVGAASGGEELVALGRGVDRMAEQLEARAIAAQEESARRMRMERLASLGSLSAGVAHQVNNPLTYMRGATELHQFELEEVLADPAAPPEAKALARRGLEVARLNIDGADRIARVVRSLRTLATPGGARETVDLGALAREALALAEAKLLAVERVEDEVPEDLVVVGDRQGLARVLVNLLLNAADAAPKEGGLVRVGGERAGDRVRLWVDDNGPPLPAEVRERLFTPFFTMKPDATGLGLSVSQRIVDDHGGALRFEELPGGGSRFALDLPAAAPQGLGRRSASTHA